MPQEGPGGPRGTGWQGQSRKAVSVASFSSTSCFSCGKGMWPASILPQAGAEEGDPSGGMRQSQGPFLKGIA